MQNNFVEIPKVIGSLFTLKSEEITDSINLDCDIIAVEVFDSLLPFSWFNPEQEQWTVVVYCDNRYLACWGDCNDMETGSNILCIELFPSEELIKRKELLEGENNSNDPEGGKGYF